MKVLFITRAYGQHAGGMERLSYEFIEAAKQHPDISATVIANQTAAGASLALSRLQSILFAFKVIPRGLAAARHADIVHLGDPVLAFIGWLIHALYGKPIIITVHGLDIAYQNPLYQFYLKIFFPTFALYLPISNYAASLLKRFRLRGRVQVLTPGVHDRFYNASMPEPDSSRTLLTTGRLVKRKGHEWFIRNVLPLLPADIVYVVAGTGPEEQNIRAAAAQSGMSSRVRLLGRVSERELKVLYNTANVFVQPNIPMSGDGEGFGIVLLEAALCSRPIIAADLEGIRDAIHDGKNGWLVSPQDVDAWVAAIADVLSGKKALDTSSHATEFSHEPRKVHPEKGFRASSGARQYTLQTFAWDKIIEAYYQAIKKHADVRSKVVRTRGS